MSIARSKVTAQGQISVPAEVRRKLGVGPGSLLEWDEEDDRIVVRRAGRYSSTDVHEKIFPRNERTAPKPVDVKQGVRAAVRKRHARR